MEKGPRKARPESREETLDRSASNMEPAGSVMLRRNNYDPNHKFATLLGLNITKY